MPPQSEKGWRGAVAVAEGPHAEEQVLAFPSKDARAANTTEASMECVLQQRLLTDFSYMEQPVRCLLTCQQQGKHLAFNGKTAFYMTKDSMHEFSLVPQEDGSMVLQDTKSGRYLCSNPTSGTIYACETPEDDKEKWIMGNANLQGKFLFSSVANPTRYLACSGNLVHTRTINSGDGYGEDLLWTLDFTSGELCFLSLPLLDLRVRCNLSGTLSMSKNYKGWEAWRLSEAGEGYVRISPWAHSDVCLSCDDHGKVYTTQERGESETWAVEKAPNGLDGVVIKSAANGRVLRYSKEKRSICTIQNSALDLDESCVWDFESLHRQTYYLVTSNSNKRLEAAKKGLGTRGLPGRLVSEEWTIQPTNTPGVVTLFSNARQQYLGSNELGDVYLLDDVPRDGSIQWVAEEREAGFVLSCQSTQRVLVAPEKGPMCTVVPGTVVKGCTRWKLEPKTPRQVNREKLSAVGAAVAIGVTGTLATGGAFGLLGLAHVGIAGEILAGSVRTLEVMNTVTRISLSSSQLILSQSSFLSVDSKSDYESETILNRPFSAWRSWA